MIFGLWAAKVSECGYKTMLLISRNTVIFCGEKQFRNANPTAFLQKKKIKDLFVHYKKG